MKAVPPEHTVARAKSGRGRCKKCRQPIAKGELVLRSVLRYKWQRSHAVMKHLRCTPEHIHAQSGARRVPSP